jgi:hypothetical protein
VSYLSNGEDVYSGDDFQALDMVHFAHQQIDEVDKAYQATLDVWAGEQPGPGFGRNADRIGRQGVD